VPGVPGKGGVCIHIPGTARSRGSLRFPTLRAECAKCAGSMCEMKELTVLPDRAAN
jgi:hypothetical protein